MSDHKTAVIVGIIVFTIAAIIGVNIGGGYYLRHTKNVDVHYIYSGYVISEVVPAIIMDDSEYVPETTITEAPKKQETKECRNLEAHPYNVIAFQTSTYEEAAVLDVSPAPDTIVRVNMAFFETSEYVEIKPQDLTSMNPSLEEREGLTLVEWGGEEIT